MIINKCICYELTFADILKACRNFNISNVEDIDEVLGICNKCCTCNPYISESLKTGVTEFKNIIL